jgi:hypothetical protein
LPPFEIEIEIEIEIENGNRNVLEFISYVTASPDFTSIIYEITNTRIYQTFIKPISVPSLQQPATGSFLNDMNPVYTFRT